MEHFQKEENLLTMIKAVWVKYAVLLLYTNVRESIRFLDNYCNYQMIGICCKCLKDFQTALDRLIHDIFQFDFLMFQAN